MSREVGKFFRVLIPEESLDLQQEFSSMCSACDFARGYCVLQGYNNYVVQTWYHFADGSDMYLDSKDVLLCLG